MRHHDQRDVLFLAGLADQVQDLLLVAGVDVGRRLVGQQELGLVGQRPGDGHPLLLAHRELRRPVRHAVAQANAVEQVPRPALVRPAAGKPHRHQHVFQGREARQQVERLENVADPLRPETVALGLGHERDVPVVDPHLARVRPADPRNDVQQGGLAAAATAHQHHLLAGGHAELGDVQHRQARAVRLPERFFEVLQEQHRTCRPLRRGYGSAATGELSRLAGGLARRAWEQTPRRASPPATLSINSITLLCHSQFLRTRRPVGSGVTGPSRTDFPIRPFCLGFPNPSLSHGPHGRTRKSVLRVHFGRYNCR